MSGSLPNNDEFAGILDQIVDLLEMQDEKAYNDGAESIRFVDDSVARIAIDDGEEKQKSIPNIGDGIANIIISFV